MIMGFDISRYQNGISPDSMRTLSGDNKPFVFIKAGQGKAETSNSQYFADRDFISNMQKFHKAGFDIGVYYYFTATTEAEAEAEAKHFYKLIEPYQDFVKWYACDAESILLPYDKNVLESLLIKFVASFRKQFKTMFPPVCLLYTNYNYLTCRLTDKVLKRFDGLWIASYSRKPQKKEYGKKVFFWQSGTVKINNIECDIDWKY